MRILWRVKKAARQDIKCWAEKKSFLNITVKKLDANQTLICRIKPVNKRNKKSPSIIRFPFTMLNSLIILSTFYGAREEACRGVSMKRSRGSIEYLRKNRPVIRTADSCQRADRLRCER